jgi:hypothetical protein
MHHAIAPTHEGLLDLMRRARTGRHDHGETTALSSDAEGVSF